MRIESSLGKKAVAAIASTAVSSATTTSSAIVDTQFFNKVTFFIRVAAWTAGTFTPLIKDSDSSSMSGATATADVDLVTKGQTSSVTAVAAAALAATGTAFVSYIGTKRYVTCDIVTTGGSVGGTVTVDALLEDPISNPIGA